MPKQTFYKLPQEKQERLLAAAKREFTQVRYSDASINQIVREAGIPRGSFYQYFEDKKDIFLCFLTEYKKEMIGGFAQSVREHAGDFLSALDDFVGDLIAEMYRTPGQGIRVIVSEPWVSEYIWADMLDPGSPDKEVCRAKKDGCAAVDWSRLDLSDDREILVFIHILGAVLRDGLCDICRRSELSQQEAKQLIHERLDSLRRHYEKRVQQ